jgi:hypothetical protein
MTMSNEPRDFPAIFRSIFANGSGPFLRAAIVLVILVGAMSLAFAQDGRNAARQACAADYKQFCAGIRPGEGRIRKCMSDHLSKLSEACRQAMNATPAK